MNADFWRSRWARGEIGFHQSDVNPQLIEYGEVIFQKQHPRVLVPLCGKSMDMRWIAERGGHVVGVELVEDALVAFVEEQGLSVVRAETAHFSVYMADQYTLLAGDIFALTPKDVGPIDA